MNPQNTQYYLLIVHYGSPEITNQALDAILAARQPPEHIIVIDNADQPFLSPSDKCVVIRTSRNIGYAGGINRGLGYLISQNLSPDDIIICMNNDVLVPPDCFTKLRDWWKSAPFPSLASVASREASGLVQGYGYVDLISGRANLAAKDSRALSASPPALRRASTKIPYLHGAFMSAPYQVWLKIKGWPDQYFMYWEDVLMSVRAARRGIALYALNHIIINHIQPQNDSLQNNQLYYLVRNGAHFMAASAPAPWRQYWRLKNRLRLSYHRLNKSRPEIINGLQDSFKIKKIPL